MLVTHLKLRKVLIVIDDADDVTQLRSLLPSCELHPDSLMIVTSRVKRVLEACCAHVSEVQLMPNGRDMQLLEAWAFPAGSPAWDTTSLVRDVVACCGRLPLTLKVSVPMLEIFCSTQCCICAGMTGRMSACLKQRYTACLQVMGAYLSSLRGQEREQDMWREALKMLQSAEDLPEQEERLFASLRISIRALKDSQRRMFLGAAFFFLGRRADTAMHAWGGCDPDGNIRLCA